MLRLYESNIKLDFEKLIQIIIIFAVFLKKILQSGGIFLLNGTEITSSNKDYDLLSKNFNLQEPIWLIDIGDINSRLDSLEIGRKVLSNKKLLEYYLAILNGDPLESKKLKMLLIKPNLYQDLEIVRGGMYMKDSTNHQLNSLMNTLEYMLEVVFNRMLSDHKLIIPTNFKKSIRIWKEIIGTIYSSLNSLEVKAEQ